MLDIVQLRDALSDTFVADRVVYRASVESTNDLARDLLQHTWSPFLVITDFQSRGRGRKGRGWSAPAGSSILASLVLDVPPGAGAQDAVHAAALAWSRVVTDAIGVPVELKWPNDLLIDSEKICGILAESAAGGATGRVIVGTGVNVNFDPAEVEDIPPGTTSLMNVAASIVPREPLVAAYVRVSECLYGQLEQDPESVHRIWSDSLSTIGKPVAVMEGARSWRGLAVGVQRDGALLVEVDGKPTPVYAADVSVRTA